MCTICQSAVRRMLQGADIAVGLFHVVQLAVKTAGDARRRAIRELYGRRGRSGDPEYGIKHLLDRNLENRSREQSEKVIETMDATGAGQHIALAWTGKEKLRDALNLRQRVTGSTPCERQARDRLFSFYDWCAQNEQVTELTALARTISRWEDEIVTAVLAGVTNARSESLNRIAKLEARHAYGFRNPASQRRRVRTACTRGTRRKTSLPSSSTPRTVTRKQHHPG
jgi:transposase